MSLGANIESVEALARSKGVIARGILIAFTYANHGIRTPVLLEFRYANHGIP